MHRTECSNCSTLRRSSLPLLGVEQSECSTLTPDAWKLLACAVDSEHSKLTVHAWSFQPCAVSPEQSETTAHAWKLWVCIVGSEHSEKTIHARSFQTCAVGAENSDCSTPRRGRAVLLGPEQSKPGGASLEECQTPLAFVSPLRGTSPGMVRTSHTTLATPLPLGSS